ncbi:MAG: hypothetical protein LBH18_02060, partial [Spirochaetaceae bacterium]|nr:hypothetical protein [Spirochaetaceae bacterium]
LIIDGPYGRAAFEKKSDLISYNGDYPDFNERARLYSEPQTTPLRTDEGMAVRISALSPLVDFNILLATMRLPFLSILVATTLAFAILIADISIAKPAIPGAKSAATPPGDELPNVLYNNGGVTFLSADKAPAPSDWGDAAGPSMEEAVAVPSGEESGMEDVADIPSFGEEADIPSFGEEADIPSFGEHTTVVQSDREYAVNESSDEYEELEELESDDYGVPFDAHGEAGKPHGGGEVADGQRDEYEKLEELSVDEDAGKPAFAPPEKNTAGTGLLATASTLYQKDGFDGMDENTEFHDILQQELAKAEKADEDIVVMSVEGTNADFSSEALIKQAADFFKAGSRFFEKDDGTGVYIIVPDASLDEIFAAAKDFYRQAVSEARFKNSGAELLIGMTARSTRTVNGINFLDEAESALYKARTDRTLPIVGFKANPQKYKDFIDKA